MSGFVIVTGGAGFIGSHVVERLRALGRRVVIVDDLSTGRRDNIAQFDDDPDVRLVVADVADPSIVATLAAEAEREGTPVDAIIHLAAMVSVTQSIEEPLADMRVNVGATILVGEFARKHGAGHIVFASSAAVYGDNTDIPLREDAPTAPLCPYATHKLTGENHLRYLQQVHGVTATALRFFNVYGPRQDASNPYSGVMTIFMDRAKRGDPLWLFGGGSQTRDFVYVGDVARAVVKAALDRAPFGPFNVGTGRETSVKQVANTIAGLMPHPVERIDKPARAGEILRSLPAVERAADALGFRAELELIDGLRAMVDHE